MNTIYNTYKAREKEFDKGFPIDFWATENCFSNPSELEFIQWQDSQTKRALLHKEEIKSFNRTSALALLESVKDFLTEGSPSRVDMLHYIEQAQQQITP